MELNESAENIQNIQQEQSVHFKEESKIQGIKFASYNTPVFKERKYKRFILTGHDNLWPNYLVKLVKDCPLNGSIIQDKARQIIGGGFTVEDSEDKDQLAQLNEFLKKINIKKSLKRWALDQQILGYWFIGVTWNKDRSKIANIYHVDGTTIRVGEPDEEGKVDHFWYSEDWSQYRKNNFRPEKIDRFDPLQRISENCLLMVRGYMPATRFYNVPGYNGGRDAIELNIELSSYFLNSIKEGFAPTVSINFNNGKPSDEEKETVYRTVNNLFKGSRGQRFLMSFNDSKENGTEVTPINTSNMSDVYARLADYAEGEILKAHKAPKVLYGIPQQGKLGGGASSNELEIESEEFFNKMIEPAQQEIEDVIQDLLLVNDFTLRVFIKQGKKLSSQYSDTIIMNTTTVDEIRTSRNLPPLSENDKKNLAINITQPPVVTTPTPADKTTEGMASDTPVNSVLQNLTGRQRQNVMGIINQYNKGKWTKEAAALLIQSGYAISDEDIDVLLPEIKEEENMSVATPGVVPYVNQVPEEKKKK